jgi:cellobiose-specific phosphotransferase system component IIA
MNKPKKIDISTIDLEELRDKTTYAPGTLPYAHHSGSAIVKAEDKGKIVGRAVAAMHEQTNMQMTRIYKQMQVLAEQAKDIQSRVEVSERIYQASISFEPLINHTYYLYERADGSDFLSMVGPEEWGRKKPFVKFVAKVKLLADHTWELLEKYQP